MSFVAYVHARPDTKDASGIFYVGKGMGKRYAQLRNRNAHHKNVVNKYGAENILIGKIECSTEEIAFDLEKGLIKCLRRSGVKLTNMTDGGEGSTGYAPSAETKRKTSKALVGIKRSLEFGAKISASKKGHVVSQETKEKLRLAKTGIASPNKGRTMSQKQKEKLSDANKGKKHNAETKKKMSESRKGKSASWLKGVSLSEDRKKQISAKLKGRVSPNKGKCLTDEQKRIRSEKITLSWIKRRENN